MTSNEQRGLDAATNVLLLKAHKLSARELAESAIAAYLEATSLREDAGIPSPQDQVVGPADQIVGQIEELFPNWRSYRDLVDCITCELHELRKRAEGGR